MLLGAKDAFCGPDSSMRYAAGQRPSDDIAGNALSWLVTGRKDFANGALRNANFTPPKAGAVRG